MEDQEVTRLPGEIVEVYCRRLSREVVETYSRPLPGSRRTEARPFAPPLQPTGEKRRKKGLWIFLGCLAVTVGLAAAAWLPALSGGWQSRPDRFDYDYEEPARGDPEEITIPAWPTGQGAELSVERVRGEGLTAQEIYRLVNPAVVTVLTDLGGGTVSIGTGVIFTQDGYVLTNHHVVEGGRECVIALDSGRRYDAKYVAGDAENDLAVLKVDGSGLPTAVFGDSDLLAVGDKVYAIGNPLGVELRGTLTDGIISAINRDVQVDGRTRTLLQTNAALNSGNSGGPLINEYGQVVGINNIKMVSRATSVEGLGFAIPSAYMERVVNDLLTFGSLQPEPTLGISVLLEGTQVSPELWGIKVVSVTEGSAADRAGVREGDFITAAGGRDILTSQELLRVRRQLHLGDELSVVLWRDGEIIEVTLTLNEPQAD